MTRLSPDRYPWTGPSAVVCSLAVAATYLALRGPLPLGDPVCSALARIAALAAVFVLPPLGILLLVSLRRKRRGGRAGSRPAAGETVSPVALWFPPGGLPRDVAAGLVLGLLLAFMSGISIQLRMAEAPVPPASELARLVWGSSSLRDITLLLLALGLVAPVAEEIFFRGVLYPAMRRSFSVVPAVVLSSMIFGAAHFDVMRLHAFLLGLVAAILVEYTSSLVPAILAHMGVNIGFVLFLANGGRLTGKLPFAWLVVGFVAMNVLFFLLGQPLFGGPHEPGQPGAPGEPEPDSRDRAGRPSGRTKPGPDPPDEGGAGPGDAF